MLQVVRKQAVGAVVLALTVPSPVAAGEELVLPLSCRG